MTFTFTDLHDIILARMALNALEIEGIETTWAQAPKKAIIRDECPSAYTLVGGVTQPAQVSKGLIRFERIFLQRFIIAPFNAGSNLNEGSEILLRAQPFYSLVPAYYLSHPRLHTETLPELTNVVEVTTVADPGLSVKPVPGGKPFAVIDFAINIIYTARSPETTIPY